MSKKFTHTNYNNKKRKYYFDYKFHSTYSYQPYYIPNRSFSYSYYRGHSKYNKYNRYNNNNNKHIFKYSNNNKYNLYKKQIKKNILENEQKQKENEMLKKYENKQSKKNLQIIKNDQKKDNEKKDNEKKDNEKKDDEVKLNALNVLKRLMLRNLLSDMSKNQIKNKNTFDIQEITEKISKNEEEQKQHKKIIRIDEKINNLNDLIKLGNLYEQKYKNDNNYNIDVKLIHNLVPSLTLLQNLIGLKHIKTQIFEQIVYYLQHLDNKNQDYLHTSITGHPGVGKTLLAKILSTIYTKLGILSKGTFKIVKRNDLIGAFLGQTAIKTTKVLEESLGGVLFIDEAYSLGSGSNGKTDSYAKEMIDLLVNFLSENKQDLIVIIAGYKEELNKCFFSLNKGLDRRFPNRYHIDKYKPIELRDIFLKKIKDVNWTFDQNLQNISLSFFKKNIKLFKYAGGSCENLLKEVKTSHSLRILNNDNCIKKQINEIDLKQGFERFKLFKKENQNQNQNIPINLNLYS